MNDLDMSVLRFFLSDSEALEAVGKVLDEGCPVCMVSEFLQEYCEQVLTVFPLHLVHWDEVANRLFLEHVGAQEPGAHDPSVPEWDPEFDRSDY